MSGALQNKSTASVSRHRDKKNAYHDHKIINNKSALSMPGPVAPREIHPQHQNWLMKFLRIKPAVTIMPFQVNRVRARKELVTLLREWRRYGMKDIVVDKAAGRVWARVGVNNCKSFALCLSRSLPHRLCYLSPHPIPPGSRFLQAMQMEFVVIRRLTWSGDFIQHSIFAPFRSPSILSPCSNAGAKPTFRSRDSRRRRARRAASSESSRRWRKSSPSEVCSWRMSREGTRWPECWVEKVRVLYAINCVCALHVVHGSRIENMKSKWSYEDEWIRRSIDRFDEKEGG